MTAKDPWVEGYLQYLLDIRRQPKRTISDVRCSLNRAQESLGEIHPGIEFWKADLHDISRFLELQRAGGKSSASLGKFVSHLRCFLEWMFRGNRLYRNVLDGFQIMDETKRTPPDVLTEEEARRLLAACPKGVFVQQRDRMIVLLLYGLGLRTSELGNLKVQDVLRDRQEVFVERGKGQRQRYVPIPEGVLTELQAYLLERGGQRGYLFRTERKGRPLNAGALSRIVVEAARRAGLGKKVTPKTLRHSYASHLMDRGVDVAVISALLGHRSPAETGVYLHALPGRVAGALAKLSGTGQDQEQRP